MAFGTAGFTAGLAIVRLEHEGLSPDRGPVIVSGATGGVGSIAIAALARLGYRVVALTGKAEEADWLKRLGAAEVKLRSVLDLSKIRPLERATWAAGIDNLGGPVLAWMLATAQTGAAVAAVGLAATHALETTVMPFILRGVSLLGVDSVNCPMPLRETVWRRLADDLRPPMLKEICRTIPFAELPRVFDDFIAARVRGRIVVDLNA
jgi:putative YhdH/YhfP family quinone oxidoreductase